MAWLTARRLAICGTVAICFAALAGQPVIQAAFQLAAAAGLISVIVGVRRHKPRRRGTWYFMGATCVVFFISYGMRLAIPGMWPHSLWQPTLADFIDALGVAAAIIGVHRAGQVRDRYRDPTTVIDSLILTGGLSAAAWIWVILPYAQDQRFSEAGRILQVSACVLALWLAFVCARLAIGPGAKTPAFRPLGFAAAMSMLSQVAGSAGTGAEDTACVAFGAVALVFVGVTALHSSMGAMTESNDQGIGKMSMRRLVLMTLAVLTAPLILIYRAATLGLDLAVSAGLIGSWTVVTLLVMVRLSGLVKARERVAETENTLRKTAASLAAATSRRDVYRSALLAFEQLVATREDVRCSFALAVDGEWEIVDSVGHLSDAAVGGVFASEAFEGLLGAEFTVVTSADGRSLDLPSTPCGYSVAIPLVARGPVRGMLLVASSERVADSSIDRLLAVASDTSLALEAMVLSEDLHRRQSEARLQALVRHSSDVTAVIDGSGLITYVTPSSESVLFRSPASLLGTGLLDIVHPDDRDVINQLVTFLIPEHAATKRIELRVSTPSNEWKTLDVTITDLRDEPSVKGVVINAHDVTERKALEQDLRHKVLHDDLTGIANRVLFRERVHHAIETRRGGSFVTAVLFIDLDDFKTVNDGLGHGAGDELLKVIAFRIESFVRGGDTAARFGGDEFAVLLENVESTEDVLNAAQRLLSVVQEPVNFSGREIQLSASVGIALAENTSTSEVVLRNADVAMYHAKKTGKGRVRLFDETMYESAFERLELKAELLHALEREELSLFYQPLISMATGQLVGFEALMRWIHPGRGFISPATFIPLAEETGLIVKIGAWALLTATIQLAEWRRNMPQLSVGMSVNVSPRQLDEDSIIENVQFALEASGIEPSWLTLELTEGSGLDDPYSRERLIALRGLGCEIAADDFGTGFASYAALQQLPFTNVKIDMSLITGLAGTDPRPHAQVRSIIQMGHALGLTITAEGIEESRQRDALVSMGADKGQGYLFSRPVPAAEANELVVEEAKRGALSPIGHKAQTTQSV